MIIYPISGGDQIGKVYMLRLITGILLVVWLGLVFLGKGGFVHALLLTALGVASVEIMTLYRARVTE